MTDQEGADLYQAPKAVQVSDADAAVAMTDILTGVIENGTAAQMDWEDGKIIQTFRRQGKQVPQIAIQTDGFADTQFRTQSPFGLEMMITRL